MSVGTADADEAGELDWAVGTDVDILDGADGLDELNLVMIMSTDATRTVTATSRTNPRPAIIKPFRRELGRGRRPGV
jgi:hypothetical protein